jgi:hypothetical protein
MSRSLVVKVLVLAVGALAMVAALAIDTTDAAAPSATTPHPPSTPAEPAYPEHPELEYERSVIRIPIRLAGDTKPREIVELTAFMKLEREAPVRNTIGYRQLEFTIREWELFGYSEALGAHISFAASQGVVQPKSLAVSLQKESDFPALIVYNAIYDIYLDGRKIVSQRPGVAMARGVMEIPPRNITVAFQKPVALGAYIDHTADDASKNHGNCDELPVWDYRCAPWIDPGTCEDMVTITAEEFEAGLQEAVAIREQLATLKPKPKTVPTSGKGSGSR